jgi:hypothetical protein
MLINPYDKSLKGGVQLQRVPVIPWDAFVSCGLKVHKDRKMQSCIFDPQPMTTADEAFQVLRLLIATQRPKPGPIAWETVPEEVARHFRFPDDAGQKANS